MQKPTPKALIIGASGFVGGYLVEHLSNTLSWKVFATKLPQEKMDEKHIEKIYSLDITDKKDVYEVLQDLRPDYIFNLAAQSNVGISWQQPGKTIEINILGTLNILEALKDALWVKGVLLVGSGEEYGHLSLDDIPVTENTIPHPGNPYAVTKNTQNQLGRIYSKAYGIPVVSTRSFNHIGPKQSLGFVVPDFCFQIAKIEKELCPPLIMVGNLEAQRDFCDVRDIVFGYGLLATKGRPGETYNIGTGRPVSIQTILDMLLSMSNVKIEVKRDASRIRPLDVPVFYADISKIQEETSWAPRISLEDTLYQTLNYWREKIKTSNSVNNGNK